MLRSMLLATTLLLSGAMVAQTSFTESAVQHGITATYGLGLMGGGVSFHDFNNDGWDDITMSTADSLPLRFFENNGNGFTEVFPNITDSTEMKQINWVDFDNDGDKDLFFTSNGAPFRLYRNEGNLNFNDITGICGFDMANEPSFGGAWGDFDNNGYLDVFISNRSTSGIPNNHLYQNNGDGTFTDVSAQAGIEDSADISFCAAFLDYDRDGWQDIYIANDRNISPNKLYHNNGDGTFTDMGALSNTGVAIDAMSTTVGDYNYDGMLDIYVTNTYAGNAFFRNNGNGTFTDVADSNGTIFNSIGWGASFLDGDNDMDLDLYVSGMLNGDSSFLPSAYYEHWDVDSFFVPQGIGFAGDTVASFSNAIGDFNRDGYPDIAVLNHAPANLFLWENNGGNKHWLKVQLQGTVSNRDGIGAFIEVHANGRTLTRYTLCGEGYLAQNSGYEMFGLDTVTTIDSIKVFWLSGMVDVLTNPTVDQELLIIEGSTITSVQEAHQLPGVQCYPNPARERLTVTSESVVSTYEVIDISGRVVQQGTANAYRWNIATDALPSGYYLLTLQTERGVVPVKFAKQ